MKNEPSIKKLRRQTLWVSNNGRWVVIAGPFPHGFPRTVDAKTIGLAAARRVDDIIARGATTSTERYAKTRAGYVEPMENEWGEVGL